LLLTYISSFCFTFGLLWSNHTKSTSLLYNSSPLNFLANWMSFGIIVTLLA
jgi:hypothetical protein